MKKEIEFNEYLESVANDRTYGLKYIAESPVQAHGGFHPTTIQIAKDALTYIAELTAREARLVEALEQEVYRLNNHDMHLDIGGMAEDSVVPCPVCEACTRIWAIIHPEDADISGGEK